ncbi:hypothetical protein Tsubulata_015978 [Turnera subulata]|uniref:Uncharacterized protein n=1 Tax=Turnera subulata TaxID=218843 RepID=A0A9Q0FH29_9ROSI|nr:hypothetical protein Tsubulata_015978 [Turnera subulata]
MVRVCWLDGCDGVRWWPMCCVRVSPAACRRVRGCVDPNPAPAKSPSSG